jgi:hypothetical protein
MRGILAAAVVVAAAAGTYAEDKGTVVTIAGMKSTTPADWKEETPSSNMRMAQFKLPAAEGDKAGAELAVFKMTASGSVDQNLERQRAKFLPAEGKDKIEEKKDKTKVGSIEAIYQDISGTYKKKESPMAEKFTPVPGQRQLYVLFDSKEGDSYYLVLLGPEKTVDKHKKAFEEWLKNFK